MGDVALEADEDVVFMTEVVDDVDITVADGDVVTFPVGKERDALELAMLQNCCDTPSADARSPGHCGSMHPTRAVAKAVALTQDQSNWIGKDQR